MRLLIETSSNDKIRYHTKGGGRQCSSRKLTYQDKLFSVVSFLIDFGYPRHELTFQRVVATIQITSNLIRGEDTFGNHNILPIPCYSSEKQSRDLTEGLHNLSIEAAVPFIGIASVVSAFQMLLHNNSVHHLCHRCQENMSNYARLVAILEGYGFWPRNIRTHNVYHDGNRQCLLCLFLSDSKHSPH